MYVSLHFSIYGETIYSDMQLRVAVQNTLWIYDTKSIQFQEKSLD